MPTPNNNLRKYTHFVNALILEESVKYLELFDHTWVYAKCGISAVCPGF